MGAAEAARHPGGLTLGVEEEYQIIHPKTGELRARSGHVLSDARRVLGEHVQPELRLSQIETATPVCRSLAEVRTVLARHRRELIEAAVRDDDGIVAAGTHPYSAPERQPITPKPRYRVIEVDYQQLARDLVIFGCHVHVGLPSRDAGIHVLNRVRLWLAPLLALSANSPFASGQDTGYASYRTEMWSQWPTSGPPPLFDSQDDYDTLVRNLVATGVIEDTSKIYWDVRLPEKLPTVEYRVTDVCLSLDDAVMIAGLVRGLTRTSLELAVRDAPYPPVRQELLRASHWVAARYGLASELFDVTTGERVFAGDLIERLLAFARPGLEAEGDWDEVSFLVREVLRRGNGAARQRDVYWRRESMKDVVDYLLRETARGTGAEALLPPVETLAKAA